MKTNNDRRGRSEAAWRCCESFSMGWRGKNNRRKKGEHRIVSQNCCDCFFLLVSVFFAALCVFFSSSALPRVNHACMFESLELLALLLTCPIPFFASSVHLFVSSLSSFAHLRTLSLLLNDNILLTFLYI